MKGFHANIEKDALENENFRKVLYTGKHSQLVLMCLQPKEEIGLEVHEAPHLRPLSKRKYSKPHEILKENMVFSVEPGLYFPKWGGIRIEDLVVIRNGKARILGKQLANFIEIN